jgi:hypothetical protein
MAFDLLSLAYHEAGHAVVARHFGCELIDVWIRPDDQCGRATVDVEGLTAEQKVFVALAGIKAQAEAGYPEPHHEMALFVDISEACQALFESDESRRWPTQDEVATFGEIVHKLIQHSAIWSAIEALAAVLAVRHAIDGATAMSIIDPILSGFAGHS